MSPQVSRNQAARHFFDVLSKRYPDLDREWLRAYINAITVEEIKLFRRDVLAEVRSMTYYHGGTRDPMDQLVPVRQFVAKLDRRISGENV